jgi:hypothetical protein
MTVSTIPFFVQERGKGVTVPSFLSVDREMAREYA